MSFAPTQPIDGETVLLCGHKSETWHWYLIPGGLRFVRPDGSEGTATWKVECDRCDRRYQGRSDVRADAVWQGNAPVIRPMEDA